MTSPTPAAGGSVGTVSGTVTVGFDPRGILRAIRHLHTMARDSERLRTVSTGVTRTMSKVATTLTLVGGAALAVNGSLNLVAGTLAILGPLVGAGLAVLPGILAGAAAAGGVLKVATIGMADAFKAVNGDAKEFQEAIKGLSPQARGFMVEVRRMVKELKPVQQAIQNAFFSGLGPELRRTTDTLLFMEMGATGVASSFNRIAKEVLTYLQSGRAMDDIDTILQGTSRTLDGMSSGITSMIRGFLQLAASAQKYATTFGNSVGNGMERLGVWLGQIDIGALFAKAQPIIQSLGVTLSNIASIFGNIFGAFATDGATASNILAVLTGQLAAFLNSAQGQQVLASLQEVFSSLASGAGQTFLVLLQELTPVIVALAPGMAQLATQISAVLVPAIQTAGPILEAIAGFLSDNMGWIGPLAIAVTGLAAAYRVYAAISAMVEAVQRLLASSTMLTVRAWLAARIAAIQAAVASAYHAAVLRGAALVATVRHTAAIIAHRVAMLASIAVINAVRFATIAWAAAVRLLSLAMAMNPIGLIIIAIIALVAIIIYAWNNSETFRNVVMAVWNAIKVAIAAVVDWIVGTAVPWLIDAWNWIREGVAKLVDFAVAYFQFWWSIIQTIFNAIKSFVLMVWNGIVAGITLYINMVRTVITTVFNFIRNYITTVFNTVRNVVQTVWSWIQSRIRAVVSDILATINRVRQVVDIVRNAFNNAKNAAQSALSNLMSLVRGIPGQISNALGNFGRLLYNKGRDLVQGLINGIKSMAQSVRNAASSLIGNVTRFLPGSPAKEGPLSGRGYVLLRARRFMADFARGIETGAQMPVAAMAGVVRPVAATVPVSGSATTSGASPTVSAPTTPGTFGPYHLTVDGKTFTSFVIDAVTGHPKEVANAAREGNRQTSWTNTGRAGSNA